MPKQKFLLPVLALIAANLLWGLNTTLIKMGVESIPPAIFMSIRFLIPSLIILPFAIYTWKRLKRRDFLLIILASIFYVSLSSLALNIGLTKTTASNAAIIWLLAPLLLFVLSASFLNERISLRTFIGICVALAGSLIIIGKPWNSDATGVDVLAGNLLIVLSVFCGVLNTIICKPLAKKMGVYQMTFMNIFPGIIPVAIYSATQLHSWDIQATTTSSFMALIFSTVTVLLANYFFFYALPHKKAHTTGVYQYLDPLATLVTAWFLLSERPDAKFAIGAALVFSGIYLAEFRKKHKIHAIHFGR